MSGGSVGLFEGKKIGRKKNLEILETEIKNTEGSVSELNKELSTIRADVSFLKTSDKKVETQRKQAELNQIRQQKVFVQTRIDNFSTFIDEADAKKKQAETRIEELSKAILSYENNLSEQKIELDHLKAQMSNADGSYRSVSDRVSQMSMAYNEKNIEFIRQQNKVSTLQRELSFREKNLSDTEGVVAPVDHA